MVNIGTITGNHKNDMLFAEYLFDAVKKGDKQKEAKIRGALQAFVAKPFIDKDKIINNALQKVQKQIQAFGVSTDLAELPRGYFNMTTEADNFDMGYEQAFRLVPKDANKRTWAIYNVENGLTVKKVPEGDKIQVDNITGSYIEAAVDYYGGAIGFTDQMIRYREIAAMVTLAELFRNKLYAQKADAHYALLAAAALLHTTAYQGAAGDGTLQRDIQTINAACFNIADAIKDKGYGDAARLNYILYFNPLRSARIFAALNATTAMLAGAGRTGETINYNITPYPTFNSSITASQAVLVLPGNKLQRAEDLGITTYDAPLDVLTLNRVTAAWSIWGAVVGDTEQVQGVSLP